MPPITRKQKAPAPIEDDTSSEDEHSEVINEPSTSTNKHECKCPVDGCEKLLTHSSSLRGHYRRAHSKTKPYECTFPLCTRASSDLYNLYSHIRTVHQLPSTEMAKKYVKVRKDIIVEETQVLGIRELFTGKVYGEEMSEDDDSDATVVMPTLPPFTTIHQTSTGHFICPFSECDHQVESLVYLRIHYRIHCHSDYRPYKCIFSVDYCRYASNYEESVKRHIRVKHFNVPESIKKWKETFNDDDRNESDFIDTRTDLLEMENALFNNAEIISSSKTNKPCPFPCTFNNCNLKCTSISHLRAHLRIHTQSKPFNCSFLNCDHSSTKKGNLLTHIQSVHFNIPAKEYKNLSKEEKERAEQYVDVDQDVLNEEEAQVARFEKRSHRKQNGQSTNTEKNDPNYCEVPFEDEETSDDEDDKDKLAPLLAIV